MTRKIIIIGTLHAGITPDQELREVLESYAPNQLLVEIAEEDIASGELTQYPSEMVFALQWAKRNHVKVFGFDAKINVFRKGVTTADNQTLIDEQKKLMRGLSWKNFNEVEEGKLLNVEGLDKVVDTEKEKLREAEMVNNINNLMVESGTIVIVTGIAHLDCFERNLKGAVLPFRHPRSVVSSDFVIKRGSLEDLKEIVAFNYMIFEGMYENEPYSLKQYREKLKDREPVILVAEKNGEMAGNSISFERDNSFYIWILGVGKNHRGGGAGSALLEKNEQFARENGYKVVSVKVYNVSTEMQSLLKRRGYEIVKVEESATDPKFTAVGLELRL